MTRIMGIDPGSRATGYGIIDSDGRRSTHIASGTVRAAQGTFPQRLKTIFDGVRELVETFAPHEIAIEEVFVHKSASSALKLGQARGAALAATSTHALPVHEYTPTKIKRAITGQGHADKVQVQHMVRVLIGLPFAPGSDQADALAVALCHAHTFTAAKATASNPALAALATRRSTRTRRRR
ncbi:MAG: crossover junction endodeoxyribonuclease RuvC [Gammaproteobacteria bacterium]|nr:crossover junction endodeoxyribonuclease RuvC [Gammaproteobacteria bacterium]